MPPFQDEACWVRANSFVLGRSHVNPMEAIGRSTLAHKWERGTSSLQVVDDRLVTSPKDHFVLGTTLLAGWHEKPVPVLGKG